MNASNLSKVRVSLTVTAVALCGAMIISASCAGNGGSGGSTGSTGSGGSTSSSGKGGSTSSGSGGSSTSASCTAGSDSVCFASGQASGVMSGWGWIALGSEDTATSPVCDNTANGGSSSQAITSANPCPESGGKTVWSSSSGLCISGSIPLVSGSSDYTANWGIQIGCNVDTSNGTLGKSYTKITFTLSGSPTPSSAVVRGEIHRSGDDAGTTYCANIQSGTSVNLTSFNTKCWDGTGTSLTASDVSKIDKIGVQISSDTTSAYSVSNFCWTGISFQ